MRIQHGFTYISLHAMLCRFLQGIWRSLMFPPKSFVFAIYSPPISPLLLTSFCTLLTLMSHIFSHFLSYTIRTFLLLFHTVVLLPEDISSSFCVHLSHFFSLFLSINNFLQTSVPNIFSKIIPYSHTLFFSPHHFLFPISPLLLSILFSSRFFILPLTPASSSPN